jgi:ParB family chromosome partitioning protein
LGNLHPWAGNPRSSPDTGAVEELAETIAAKGLLQTLLVRPYQQQGLFQVIAGNTRLAALKMLANSKRTDPDGRPFDDHWRVPIRVRQMSDPEALEAAAAENTGRRSMSGMDEARAISRIIANGASVAEAAARIGITRAAAHAGLGIMSLPPAAHALLESGKRPYGWGVALIQASPALRQRIADEATANMGAWPTADSIRDGIASTRVPVTAALFDVASSGLAVDRDLIGGCDWFADPDAFWTLQNQAISELRTTLLAAGHEQVTVVQGRRDDAWRWVRDEAAGRDAFIVVAPDGSVSIEEWLRPIRSALTCPTPATEDLEPSPKQKDGPLERAILADARRRASRTLEASPTAALRLVLAALLLRLDAESSGGSRPRDGDLARLHESLPSSADDLDGKLAAIANRILTKAPKSDASRIPTAMAAWRPDSEFVAGLSLSAARGLDIALGGDGKGDPRDKIARLFGPDGPISPASAAWAAKIQDTPTPPAPTERTSAERTGVSAAGTCS